MKNTEHSALSEAGVYRVPGMYSEEDIRRCRHEDEETHQFGQEKESRPEECISSGSRDPIIPFHRVRGRHAPFRQPCPSLARVAFHYMLSLQTAFRGRRFSAEPFGPFGE